MVRRAAPLRPETADPLVLAEELVQADGGASPVRTCIGCRKRTSASELLRFTAVAVGADHRLQPDPDRRLPGRGAHVHPDPACFALAERRRAFGRALRITGVPDTGALAEHVRAVHVPHGATDGGAWEPHPDSQGRTTNMSTR